MIVYVWCVSGNGQSIFAQLPSLTTSMPDFQESQQLFSTQNQEMPASGTTGQPPAASTLLPPRKNDYRIVYTIMITNKTKNCSCPYLSQYNPVCGTDGQTYGNLSILNCNKECGVGKFVLIYSTNHKLTLTPEAPSTIMNP